MISSHIRIIIIGKKLSPLSYDKLGWFLPLGLYMTFSPRKITSLLPSSTIAFIRTVEDVSPCIREISLSSFEDTSPYPSMEWSFFYGGWAARSLYHWEWFVDISFSNCTLRWYSYSWRLLLQLNQGPFYTNNLIHYKMCGGLANLLSHC